MTLSQKEYVQQWLMKADEDLLVVEKLLKAFLIANGQEIIKTHNIEFLLSECSEIDGAFSTIDPKNLSDYGVDVRYPGDMYVPCEDEVIFSKEITLVVKALVESRVL